MIKEVAFLGSFQTFHKGHQHILNRASKIFQKVHVIVLNNEQKQNHNSLEARYKTTQETIAKTNLNNVVVHMYEGQAVSILRKLNVSLIIRGIRNTRDYQYEKNLEKNYKKLDSNLEVIYLLEEKESD